MNVQRMHEYVEYTADFLLKGLGFPPRYGKANPVRAFSYMLWLRAHLDP